MMSIISKKVAGSIGAALLLAGAVACAQDAPDAQRTPAAPATNASSAGETLDGLHNPAGQGEIFMGGPGNNLKIEVLVPPEVSFGAFDVIQETHFEGFSPPIHHHPTASETFYVIKGRYTWTVGNATYEVGPGDTVHVPANTAHTMISHEEGIVNMTYVPSGLVQRLRMSKAFGSELENSEFRANLTALTGHINGRPGEPAPAGDRSPNGMGMGMGMEPG